jgi:hypothetical protein
MDGKAKHIGAKRLCLLAQMGSIVDQWEWRHIQTCSDCAAAFMVLKGAIEQSLSHPEFYWEFAERNLRPILRIDERTLPKR